MSHSCIFHQSAVRQRASCPPFPWSHLFVKGYESTSRDAKRELCALFAKAAGLEMKGLAGCSAVTDTIGLDFNVCTPWLLSGKDGIRVVLPGTAGGGAAARLLFVVTSPTAELSATLFFI